MEKQKKPLSFGMTMLASALGIVIVSVLGGLITFISMIVMVAMLGSMDKESAVVVKNGTFLTVDLAKISGDRTATGLQASFSDTKTIGLIDAENAIRAAAKDDKVAGILLKGCGNPAISWGSLTELRSALEDFRESGKSVVAYATSYSQGEYYLASLSDRICLHPSGMVDFRGMGAEVMYYKDLLDKLGVEMQLIRPESCSYKSAGEVYTLNHMSDANREQIRAYIASIWRTATESIAASRGMDVEKINAIADDLSGFMADGAKENRLVDILCFEEDVRTILKEMYAGKQLLPLEKYASNVKKTPNKAKESIAVIYAQGNVMDGSSKGFNEGVFGDDIVKALKQAAKDDDVKAIVLRVNSPGGQATASESMTHAVIAAREKKPVIVSMGDLAASAGYEMSCMADVIVAQPTTITGSIGVFGTIPNVGKLMRQKLGLNTDTVSTNRNANGLTIFRPLSPTAKAMWTKNVEDFYKIFVGRVAEGRHMTYDEVHQIARGRVWTGADAIGIGLVDTLGGIDLALNIAAEKAGLSDYKVKEFPKEKDTWTQLSELLGESSDDDLNLLAKMRLAVKWRIGGGEWKVLDRMEQDLLFVTESEGLQARLPFVIVKD
ncbi:MAG: signal peptide peptidase SppA [Bacteroidales bacterium]|nr:signal peptide peptidase SppA [Bacteroidales bacterium]